MLRHRNEIGCLGIWHHFNLVNCCTLVISRIDHSSKLNALPHCYLIQLVGELFLIWRIYLATRWKKVYLVGDAVMSPHLTMLPVYDTLSRICPYYLSLACDLLLDL
jgi:hypothetical protein